MRIFEPVFFCVYVRFYIDVCDHNLYQGSVRTTATTCATRPGEAGVGRGMLLLFSCWLFRSKIIWQLTIDGSFYKGRRHALVKLVCWGRGGGKGCSLSISEAKHWENLGKIPNGGVLQAMNLLVGCGKKDGLHILAQFLKYRYDISSFFVLDFCQILGKSVFAKQAEFVANVSVWHDSIFILSESGAAVGAFHILMTCAELKVGDTPCDLLKSSSWLFI